MLLDLYKKFGKNLFDKLVIAFTHWRYGQETDEERKHQGITAERVATIYKDSLKEIIWKKNIDMQKVPTIFLDNIQFEKSLSTLEIQKRIR